MAIKGFNLSKTILPEGGIFAMAMELATSAVDGLAQKVGELQLPSLSGSIAMVGDSVKTAIGAFGRDESAPVTQTIAKAEPAQEVTVTAPKPELKMNNVKDVSLAELGDFSAPSFSNAPISVGTRTV